MIEALRQPAEVADSVPIPIHVGGNVEAVDHRIFIPKVEHVAVPSSDPVDDRPGSGNGRAAPSVPSPKSQTLPRAGYLRALWPLRIGKSIIA